MNSNIRIRSLSFGGSFSSNRIGPPSKKGVFSTVRKGLITNFLKKKCTKKVIPALSTFPYMNTRILNAFVISPSAKC